MPAVPQKKEQVSSGAATLALDPGALAMHKGASAAVNSNVSGANSMIPNEDKLIDQFISDVFSITGDAKAAN